MTLGVTKLVTQLGGPRWTSVPNWVQWPPVNAKA